MCWHTFTSRCELADSIKLTCFPCNHCCNCFFIITVPIAIPGESSSSTSYMNSTRIFPCPLFYPRIPSSRLSFSSNLPRMPLRFRSNKSQSPNNSQGQSLNPTQCQLHFLRKSLRPSFLCLPTLLHRYRPKTCPPHPVAPRLRPSRPARVLAQT